jgi:hypothetical protein
LRPSKRLRRGCRSWGLLSKNSKNCCKPPASDRLKTEEGEVASGSERKAAWGSGSPHWQNAAAGGAPG